MKGTFQRMYEGKGYTFLTGEDGHSYFAHARDFLEAKEFIKAKEGDKAIFQPTETPKGLRAKEIQLCLR